jgi:hypothetical protein
MVKEQERRIDWRLLGLVMIGCCLIEAGGIVASRHTVLSWICNTLGVVFIIYDMEITK